MITTLKDLVRRRVLSLAETVSQIDRLTDEERECIGICNEAAEVCEWCADECLGDEKMEECAEELQRVY